MNLKNTLFIMLFLAISVCTNAQSKSKLEAIDILLKETKAKESSQEVMSILIKEFLKRKPNAPKTIEHEIQGALNYKDYMDKVRSVYADAYTEEEIRNLTQLHKTDKEKYKQKSERVAKGLYNLGTEFGRKSVDVINAMLQFYR